MRRAVRGNMRVCIRCVKRIFNPWCVDLMRFLCYPDAMSVREIVLDTETTGFAVEDHRIVEIGCLELMNGLPTGQTYHVYLNPEREIDFSATRVHGITNEQVAYAAKFADIADAFLDFLGDGRLVIHNAEFDMAFLNMELGRCGLPMIANDVVDTLAVARQKLPGQRHNLDALCRHFNVDNSGRAFHGALLDAQLLADVYIELNGGLQGALVLEAAQVAGGAYESQVTPFVAEDFVVRGAREDEILRHQTFLEQKVKGALWLAAPEKP